MGVNGLWRLLMPIGRRISVETLTNKTLAIDASIWLTQFLKAMRDPITGQTKPSAHLIGFIRRICKLLYFGIKPVFVFDGPTPQIKLREIRARRLRRERGTLFAGEDISGDDLAIKKLARRILLQQIQAAKTMQKTEDKTNVNSIAKKNEKSSFADDFNLDPDDSVSKDVTNLKNNDEQNDNSLSKSQEIKKDEVIRNTVDLNVTTSENNEWNEINEAKDHSSNLNDVNDFDKPISIDSDSDRSENNLHKKRKYSYNNYKTNIEIPSDHSDLDEDALINMPSRMRTNIFENVLKQQRMKSRQECMPVAANPYAYSQVQLKNFLKRSHLNQKINRIVSTGAADNDQNEKTNGSMKNKDFEMGEHIASDPSTRFIYTKDSDDENTKIEQPQHRNRLKRKRDICSNNRKNNDNDNDDDDDDDLFFHSVSQNESKNISSAGKKSNKFQDSDGENSDTNQEGGFMADDEDVSEKTYIKENTDVESKANNEYYDSHLNSDDDEGGGFMASSENEGTNENKNLSWNQRKKSEVTKQILEDEMLARAIEEVEEEGEGAVGFIQHDYYDPKKKEDRFTPHSPVHEDTTMYKNATINTIMNNEPDTNCEDDFDEIYRAKHQSDDNDFQSIDSELKSDSEMEGKKIVKTPLKKEKLLEFFSQFGGANNSDSDSDIIDQDKDEVKGITSNTKKQCIDLTFKTVPKMPDKIDESDSSDCQVISVFQKSENKSKAALVSADFIEKQVCDSESDSDDINWEEGSQENDSVTSKTKTNDHAQIELTLDKKNSEKNMVVSLGSSKCGALNEIDGKEETSMILEGKSPKIDSIRKGDDKDNSLLDTTTPSKIGAFTGKSENIEFNDNDITISVDEPTKSSYEFKTTDDFTLIDDVSKSDVVNDSNEAALLHAQKTASNLADWAGRAFRRALAGHIDVKKLNTDKSSSNLKSEKNFDVDESSESSDESIESSGENTKKNVQSVKDDRKQSFLKDAIVIDSRSDEKPDKLETKSFDARGNEFVETIDTQQALFNASNETMNQLSDEKDLLNEEMKRHERDLATVTDEMKSEIIQLLHIFGIPYVESPSEAEAQCVALEELGLVDGIVTEDSDVFVFGGKNIYKNIFDDKKYVEIYLATDAERELALAKNDMIALAMLLGGDYTEGVKGVGIVNGMEILQAFPVSNGVKEGLLEFRKWLDGFDPIMDMSGSKSGKNERKKVSTKVEKFHVKHRTARARWIAPKSFPAPNVLNAYSKPVVDKSEVRFSWGVPDLDGARVFCHKLIGWRHEETDKVIVPVLKEMAKTSRQTKLESYFMSYRDNIKFADVRSKRLQKVMKDIQSKKNHDENNTHEHNISLKTEIQSNDLLEKKVLHMNKAKTKTKTKTTKMKKTKTKINKRKSSLAISASLDEGQVIKVNGETKIKDEVRGYMDESNFTFI